MEEKYEYFSISLIFGGIFPLADGEYHIPSRGINGITITVKNEIDNRQSVGPVTFHGNVSVFPQSRMGLKVGIANISVTYHLAKPFSIEEFGSHLSLSPIWHLSPTGWDFFITELNRIIDLYRSQSNAYWWYHIGGWDIEHLVIYGRPVGTVENKALLTAFPKIYNFTGKPLDGSVYDMNSPYVRSILNDQYVPFYHVLYMNGRRSLAEHSYREALVNWANCIEAYSMYLLDGAMKFANTPEAQARKIFRQADTYQKRFSKAYEILSTCHVYPSISKKQVLKLVDEVMEHRNQVMHGQNPIFGWSTVSSKFEAMNQIIGIALEVFEPIKHRL